VALWLGARDVDLDSSSSSTTTTNSRSTSTSISNSNSIVPATLSILSRIGAGPSGSLAWR